MGKPGRVRDFEQASMFRVTPTLVCEPGSLMLLSVCSGVVLFRRRAA